MRYTMVQFSIDRTRLENILPRGKLPYPFLSVSRKGGDGRVIVMSWVEHERSKHSNSWESNLVIDDNFVKSI